MDYELSDDEMRALIADYARRMPDLLVGYGYPPKFRKTELLRTLDRMRELACALMGDEPTTGAR